MPSFVVLAFLDTIYIYPPTCPKKQRHIFRFRSPSAGSYAMNTCESKRPRKLSIRHLVHVPRAARCATKEEKEKEKA